MPDAPARPGMTRREMIRAAAAAGVAAWTTPLVVESLASPAAAGSAPCSCTHYFAAKIESISTPPFTVKQGFTGDDANAAQWAGFHAALILCTGASTSGGCSTTYAVPGYALTTGQITLPAGCSFGAAGTVFVHYGRSDTPQYRTYQATGDSNVYTGELDTQNNFNAISPTDTTFALPDHSPPLSYVNVVWCCCS